MASLELIAVGTEMLLGQLVDTNTAHIAAVLAERGIDVHATHVVGDNRERIASAVRSALTRCDGIVMTGGLGPTVDDLTKEAVCDALALETELYEPGLRQMEAMFERFGRSMRENNRKQAELPRGSLPMPNPNGTAPGFIAFDRGEKFVACMPGVPREMKPMLAQHLVPFLAGRLGSGEAIYTRIIHTIGLGESEIDHRIADLFRSSQNPKIAVLAHDFRADVKVMAKSSSAEAASVAIAPLEREIARRLDGYVFGYDETTPAGAVHALLRSGSMTLASAESCTGGTLAAALTSVPGASQTFVGGIVAYANALKNALLGVDEETLARHGAVSEETAREMARGVRMHLAAGVGIATTGVAGPDGGSAEKPVGLVWLAVDDGVRSEAVRIDVPGDRETVSARATTAALGLLWRHLRGQSS